MPYKVFISHAESDRDLALKVAQEVERSGGEAIFGPSSLRQGAKIPPKIVEALRQSDVVVGIASSNSSQSAWFNAEMGAAWGLAKIIVLVADNVQPKELPPTLRSLRTVGARQIGRYLRQLSQEAKPETVAR